VNRLEIVGHQNCYLLTVSIEVTCRLWENLKFWCCKKSRCSSCCNRCWGSIERVKSGHTREIRISRRDRMETYL